jgi:hypothetical protein
MSLLSLLATSNSALQFPLPRCVSLLVVYFHTALVSSMSLQPQYLQQWAHDEKG